MGGQAYLLVPFPEQLLALVLGDGFGMAMVGAGQAGAGEGQQGEESGFPGHIGTVVVM